MSLYRASAKGNIPFTPEEEAEFIANLPQPQESNTKMTRQTGNDKLDALIDALISKGVLSDDDAKTIKSGK